jgi:hypothetical protein
MAYKNPILKFDVRHMSSENKRKDCGAKVLSTTRGGTT